jgi:hypothetical protein
MKKFFSLLAVLSLVTMASSSLFADINIVKSAFASFDEVAMVFDVHLYEWVPDKDFTTYTGDGLDAVAFDVSGVTPGNESAQWASGDVFAKIHSNLSSQQSGTVYMYTKNTTAGDYQAKAGRTSGEDTLYSGLVRKGNSSTYQAGDFAPLFVKCKKISDANESYKTTKPADFSAEEPFNGSRILVDYSDSTFSTLPDNARVIGMSGVNGGIWVGYGVPSGQTGDPYNWYAGSEDVIMFFGANFDHVMSGSEYGTTTIKFVQTIE